MKDALVVGAMAPDFTLLDDGGRKVKLSSLRGAPVVLFFYAEADTPVCTQQACGFRDEHAGFAELGARVLGVSADAPERLAAFRASQRLPYTLLSDPGNAVATRYGAHGQKQMYGRTVVGTIRSSVIVGSDGRIAGVYRSVRSKPNGPKMLAELRRVVGE